MTTTASAETAARHACRQTGLPANSLTPLHDHATSVFLLPAEHLVVRVSRADQLPRLETAIALTRWLTDQDYPATQPADLPQPVICGLHAVTFWHHYPQPITVPTPPTSHLGTLLRRLHTLPHPPLALPEYQPLTSLTRLLETSHTLDPDRHDWLRGRVQEALDAYSALDFPLGHGLIHGDAYPGNTLWDGTNVRLGDWDEAATGPRELDLANTFQGVRFGRTGDELDTFSDHYGYDIRHWPGLTILRQIRDLHTLSSYIRRADRGDKQAEDQLAHRITTLQRRDDSARWVAA
ncbi:phosphotransferase family protein [Streptomyces melanogenes]|uniref:phosphotransferase family protein n=1 Tax=Streptomyces melanogenes TaxID=67326 RepID=UPI0037B60AD6